MFWYHPHVRAFDQVEKSLYGVLLVRDPAKKEAALGLDRVAEHVFVFDDLLIDRGTGEILPAFRHASDPLANVL